MVISDAGRVGGGWSDRGRGPRSVVAFVNRNVSVVVVYPSMSVSLRMQFVASLVQAADRRSRSAAYKYARVNYSRDRDILRAVSAVRGWWRSSEDRGIVKRWHRILTSPLLSVLRDKCHRWWRTFPLRLVRFYHWTPSVRIISTSLIYRQCVFRNDRDNDANMQRRFRL